MNFCLLVPHYNHLQQFKAFLPQLRAGGWPCIVVDDGSDFDTVRELRSMLADQPDIRLLELSPRSGKGMAVLRGAQLALELGHTHSVQIDADGQHAASSIPELIATSRRHPAAIISGLPSFDHSVPAVRYWGRKITLYLSRLESLSSQIEDAMCGFRVYPLQQLQHVTQRYSIGKGMDFDTEILVKSVWSGVAVHYVSTPVHYAVNGVSHFHYFKDNLVMTAMHLRLLAGMLLRVPRLFLHNKSERL